MSWLKIYADDKPDAPLAEHKALPDITAALGEIGVRFERWQANAPLVPGAKQDTVLAAYADDIQRLKDDNGFTTADVVALTADHPQKDAFRTKFLDEHTHSEDEIRFFVDGHGLFYLHVGTKVYVVRCERDDLISVPAGTTHWFDMGPEPHFTCIRLFTNPEGWVAEFTGNAIASEMPRYEELAG